MDWTIEFDKAIEQYLPDLEVLQDEPMSRHTTFRIGGPAKRMAFPSSREQLVLLMSFAKDYGANPLVIGNGSNLLVPDEGLDRLVIDTSANLNPPDAPSADCAGNSNSVPRRKASGCPPPGTAPPRIGAPASSRRRRPRRSCKRRRPPCRGCRGQIPAPSAPICRRDPLSGPA